MPAVRLIPCLDVKAGRVVKGVSFRELRDAGNPAELAGRYYEQGADEIVILDIAATLEERCTLLKTVRAVAESIFVPLTVGGGLRSLEDIRAALQAGADKVSLCSSALADPELISRAARQFGSQCVVLAIDARKTASGWRACSHAGTLDSGRDALAWAREGRDLGAGEILLTSMDRDGRGTGYDLELLAAMRAAVDLPLIASGGAGTPEQLLDAIETGGADAVLLASMLHYQRYSIPQLKSFLKEKGVQIR